MDETRVESLNGAALLLEEETDMELEEFVTDKDSLIDPGKESVPLRNQPSLKHDTIFGFDGLRVIIVSSVVVSLAITAALVITILVGKPQVPPHGAVATGNQQCSDVGVSILRKGGSAVDAAIAAMLCIGVVNSQSSGIGGGGFMLILDAEKASYTGINFRETAPGNATFNMFAGSKDTSLYGGLAVGIPGELHGMRLAWESYGKLPWWKLFQPAIRKARTGITVSRDIARGLMRLPLSKMSYNFKQVFAPNGVKVKEGDTVYRTNYGDLLERIANNGIQEFYSGSNAREIADIIARHGGVLSETDLQNYRTRSLTPVSIKYRARGLMRLPLSKMSYNFKQVFAPNGVKVKEGDTVYRTNYGDLLERIANNGIQEFYSGSNAREIADIIARHGGVLSETDLQNYRTRSLTPVSIKYRDYNLVTLPEPSGGPSLLTLINVLELYNLTTKDRDTSLYYHRLIEALKFVKAQEIGLGDSAMANYSQQMMSKENAELIFANITDNMTHPTDYYMMYAQSVLKTKGTSHISVIDTKNNMVSVTTSVNMAFGSLLMTSSGVILNNNMDDFDWPGKNDFSGYSKSNYIGPGKRPQSHIAPIMGRNTTTACARRFATGGEGGSKITAAITQVVMELLAFHSSLDNATDPLKRVYPSLDPNTVKVEADLSEEIIADLRAKQHDIERSSSDFVAIVNTVMKEQDIIYAKSDPRRDRSGANQY